MRRKLDLDTSVLGALADPGPQDRVVATRRLLEGLEAGFWEGYISPVLLEEVERAPKTAREEIGQELQKGFLTVLGESAESIRVVEFSALGEHRDEAQDKQREPARGVPPDRFGFAVGGRP